jgi:hypothetical protein
MSTKFFRTVLFCLLADGLVLTVAGVFVSKVPMKAVLLTLAGAFYLAAAIQVVLYKIRPTLFDEKRWNKN